MNRSIRLVNRVINSGSPQGGLISVRNAGGPAAAHGPGLPFPPGPRQFEQAKNWLGSATIFGATAFGLLCYFSDWRVIVSYIPFYNGKFREGDEAAEAAKK